MKLPTLPLLMCGTRMLNKPQQPLLGLPAQGEKTTGARARAGLRRAPTVESEAAVMVPSHDTRCLLAAH